ncbi:hypothetical protein AF335_03405 [Streptomyces eurocidicus]|uniref:Uncharacterized protein n=1 Tax=Streptomyces eurocidicus TaxID=66423 RepID=A0A2N8P309_STREU|nr:hypothetical protein [Streptomyces eurocidicus]MBB5117571.1 hypothetical protein [Streptomyces eurocidicus]MBF6053411.1 hypothetical protein [Streptomyces eurocidicus]PNE35398.1 hypothetical protein AF335_03405 [Streptomyces eurocidicus]
MRTYVVHQPGAEVVESGASGGEESQGADAEDFKELFLGRPGESAEERAARTSAASDVLEELQDQSEADEFALLNARYAAKLSSVAAMRNRVHTQAGRGVS